MYLYLLSWYSSYCPGELTCLRHQIRILFYICFQVLILFNVTFNAVRKLIVNTVALSCASSQTPATCVAFSSNDCCRVCSSGEVTIFLVFNKVTLDLWPHISLLVPSVGSSHSNHLSCSVSSTTYQLLWQSKCIRLKDLQAYCSHM